MTYYFRTSPASDIVIAAEYRAGFVIIDHGFEAIPVRPGQSVSGAIIQEYPGAEVWLQ